MNSEQMDVRIKELETAINNVLNGNLPVSSLQEVMTDNKFLNTTSLMLYDEEYIATSQYGNRISDGMMGRAYRNKDGLRVWMYRNGIVFKD